MDPEQFSQSFLTYSVFCWFQYHKTGVGLVLQDFVFVGSFFYPDRRQTGCLTLTVPAPPHIDWIMMETNCRERKRIQWTMWEQPDDLVALLSHTQIQNKAAGQTLRTATKRDPSSKTEKTSGDEDSLQNQQPLSSGSALPQRRQSEAFTHPGSVWTDAIKTAWIRLECSGGSGAPAQRQDTHLSLKYEAAEDEENNKLHN